MSSALRDTIYSRLSRDYKGQPTPRIRSLLSDLPQVSGPANSRDYLRQIGDSFSLILQDHLGQSDSKNKYTPDPVVESTLTIISRVISLSLLSSNPAKYARFLTSSRLYSNFDLTDNAIEFTLRLKKPKTICPSTESVQDGVAIMRAVIDRDHHTAFMHLRAAALKSSDSAKHANLDAVAAAAVLFGGLKKLIPIIGRENVESLVPELSGGIYNDLSSCPKSFLIDPDPVGSFSFLKSLGLVKYSYNDRLHVAKFDSTSQFAGATVFHMFEDEDFPDTCSGFYSIPLSGPIILIDHPSSMQVPVEVVRQHELTHHFDNIFSIRLVDRVHFEARAYSSELCFTSMEETLSALDDLKKLSSNEGDSLNYHKVARATVLKYLESRPSNIMDLSRSDSERYALVSAVAKDFLNHEYFRACGLTYDQILEPFNRLAFSSSQV